MQLRFSFYNAVSPRLIQLVLFCIWGSSHPKQWKIVPSNYRWSLDSLAWNMRSLGSWHDWPLLSYVMLFLTLYSNFQPYPTASASPGSLCLALSLCSFSWYIFFLFPAWQNPTSHTACKPRTKKTETLRKGRRFYCVFLASSPWHSITTNIAWS